MRACQVHAALPDTPLLVLAGHSHYRRFAVFGRRTLAIESGNYFNTAGWLALDRPAAAELPLAHAWRMLDANRAGLAAAAAVEPAGLLTAAGAALRARLRAVCHPGRGHGTDTGNTHHSFLATFDTRHAR